MECALANVYPRIRDLADHVVQYLAIASVLDGTDPSYQNGIDVIWPSTHVIDERWMVWYPAGSARTSYRSIVVVPPQIMTYPGEFRDEGREAIVLGRRATSFPGLRRGTRRRS